MEWTIRVGTVTRALLLGVFVMVVLSFAGQCSRHLLDHRSLFGMIDLFDLRHDVTVPTWWSSVLLLIGAVVFVVIASESSRADDRLAARGWTLAALILLVFSIDEVAAIHERIIGELRTRIGSDQGAAGYAGVWLGFGGVVIIGLALVFWRFLASLPRKTRRWLILAAALFFGGSVGMETVSAFTRKSLGEDVFLIEVISTLEEALEMIGAVFAIHAGLLHLTRERPDIRLTLRVQANQDTSALDDVPPGRK